MAGMMRVPRSRGAISGVLLILLGAWGALIPFIGPYFHYSYAPDSAWHYTTGRLLLEILPGAATVLGGLMTLVSANRLVAMFGGWLAAVSGAWFVLGATLSSIWGSPGLGAPTGGTTRHAFEYIGMLGGLGAVIVFFAAFALGRFTVRGVREAEWLAARTAADEPAYGTSDGTVDSGDRGVPAAARDGDYETAPTSHRRHWPSLRHHAGV